ncbi:MAG: hypothetical protein AB2L24_27660 [Mangrovibacterium sp.]
MDTSSELINQIRKLLEKRVGKIKHPLSFSTRIENDIKIAGDDAYEFIIEFGKKFNVEKNLRGCPQKYRTASSTLYRLQLEQPNGYT